MAEVQRLTEPLRKEPCDRHKILDLGELLLGAGDGRGTLKELNAFLAKCGDYPRLRRVTLAAHMRLSEWDEATSEATKLIASDPYDADFRGWRGLVYEQQHDWDHAADDYRQALLLKPRLSDVPINLANVYERQGKTCDAIFPLEQLVFYSPGIANLGTIRARIGELARKGNCRGIAGEGKAQIRMNAGEGLVRVTVTLEGRESGTFVVDTGASYVTVTQAFAKRNGLDLMRAPTVLIATANGSMTALVVTIGKVEVQGAKAVRVPAVVVDDLGPSIDGLLGLSFLSRFDFGATGSIFEIAAKKQ